MKEVFVVPTAHNNMAREIEKLLISLPWDCGILFVGVRVVNSERPYEVTVGVVRSMEVGAIEELVPTFLKQNGILEEADKLITVNVFRGVSHNQL